MSGCSIRKLKPESSNTKWRSRMQASIPELTDLRDEPESVFDLYGPDSRRPGSYAANCILARRLAERDVRFIQLFHPDWDHHSRLSSWCVSRCVDTDQASAALVLDLKRRGLLDDTLVLWGGEFGRGVAGQGKWDSPEAGRDHHPRCFTIWMAGAGVKPGFSYGAHRRLQLQRRRKILSTCETCTRPRCT